MSSRKALFVAAIVSALAIMLALFLGNARGEARTLADVSAPGRSVADQAAQPVGEVSGVAQPGDQVRVTQGDALIGETVAGADGAWKLPIQSLPAPDKPLHAQILPSPDRGAGPEPGPITITVQVRIGESNVQVRVQVISPNGQVDVEVLAPLPPCECEANGQSQQAAPAAQQAAPQPATNAPAIHVVRAGETLAIIGARYGVSAQAIVEANKLRNANMIYVGQRLRIPERAR